MAESKLQGVRFDIGSIAITGAPAGTSAVRLDQAIREGFGRALGGSELTANVQLSGDIPRMRLQLPPRATEAQIAEAVALAIARAGRGGRA